MELMEIEAELRKFIRPNTFPLGVKFFKASEEIPKRARFPYRDMGIQIMPCQGLTMARRYGWTVGLRKEDIKCGTGLIVTGFAEAPPEYYEGKFSLTPATQSSETRSIRLQSMDRLPLNEGGFMVVAPIAKQIFEPDIYLVYGTPAQVLRLVQSSLYKRGGYMTFRSAGGASCGETFASPIVHDQCTLILIGNGERVFAHAADDEMCFAIPKTKIKETISGLQPTHDGGQRYPVAFNVRYEPDIPEGYMTLTNMLKK